MCADGGNYVAFEIFLDIGVEMLRCSSINMRFLCTQSSREGKILRVRRTEFSDNFPHFKHS